MRHVGLFLEELRDGATHAEFFRETLEIVDAAEAWGLDGIWLGEIHFLPTRSVLSSPLVVATAISSRTRRMCVGTAVHVLPLRNPLSVAEDIATLDHLSGGRQAPAKVRRIGWLTGGSPQSHARLLEAFREGLKEHGWVEGRNITLELRWAEGRLERLSSLAADLVRLKPDVIVAAASPVILAVKKETSTIPIVMATGADPVGAGLVASYARPGGNVTGLAGFFEATPIKMLELVAGLVSPGARVSMLLETNTPFARDPLRGDYERTAKTLGLRAEYVEVTGTEDVTRALAALAKNPPAALVVLPGSMLFYVARSMVSPAATLKVPVLYPFEESVEAGGLMSYAADLADSYRRAARYVDRILKGARPAEMPIEQPTRLTLVINMTTARAQKIDIPPRILLRADRVIE